MKRDDSTHEEILSWVSLIVSSLSLIAVIVIKILC